jgi:hypothetical protein
MTAHLKSAWDRTAGYKTKSGAVLLAIYMMVEAVAPGLMKGQTQEIVRSGIDLLIITGGADWAWRNRKDIANWITVNVITKIFTKKKEN